MDTGNSGTGWCNRIVSQVNERNWKRLWIVLVLILAPGGVVAQEVEAKLAQRADFVPAAQTVREQLVEVAQHYKIPMGIEWVLRPEEKAVKLSAGEAPTVLALLNLILQATPPCSVNVRNGVVNVSDSRYAVDSRNFLNLRIDELTLTKANVYDANFELRLRINMTLHPERYAGGWNGGYGYGVSDKDALAINNISFTAKDSTVRDLLDRIVLANGNALWVVNLVPARMMKKEPFFAQFDSDQEMNFSWTITPFNTPSPQ